MDSLDPGAGPTSVVPVPAAGLRDARGQPYEPAVGPRLRVLLAFIFAAVAVLGATAVYLLGIRLLNSVRAPATYTNQFTIGIFMVHEWIGVLIVAPFLFFGLTHLAAARHRPNRLAVRLGVTLFLTCIVVGLTGLALLQLPGMPQVQTGTLRTLTLTLHSLAPVVAVALYVLHRRAGPEIHWKWGITWGVVVGLFVLVMGAVHSVDPRPWYAKGSPEGEKYYEPSKVRTPDGNFIPEAALMMDSYCLKCHQDIYHGWFHSAHHFSSFNNPAYLFSVKETREVALKRDGNVRASRWCAGCHDPVPFLAGKFDDPDYDIINDRTAHAGITCTVCHAMVNINSTTGNGDYTIEEPLHYPFAYSKNALLQWLNNQAVKAKPDFHKQTFLKPFHLTAEFCSTCHKVSIPVALNHYKEFLRGQNHYDAFVLSGVGHGARSFYYPPQARANCAACHMPLQPSNDFGSRDRDGSGIAKIHNHLFPAANTGLAWLLSLDPKHRDQADGFRQAAKAHGNFLRGGDANDPDNATVSAPPVRIDIFGLKKGGSINDPLVAPLRPRLEALEPGHKYLVEVVIRTLNIGHPLTQGTVDSNELWVDFTARSGKRVIGRNGALGRGEDQGRVDEWAHFVNVLMLDRNGNRINRRNPQDIFTPLYDHQIPPGAGQVVHYLLEVPKDLRAPVELKVRLRYRKFDFEYMSLVHGGDDKVPELPVVDLCADTVTLPVRGVAGHVPEQSSPVKPAWQRWNDYGIGCFLETGLDTKQGEWRQAEQAFRKLLEESDSEAHGQAYLNLARICQAEGRLAEAVDMLNQARTAGAPWWTVAWFTGLVNARNTFLDRAIADFEQILAPANQPRQRQLNFTRDYVVINELGKTLFNRALCEHQDLAAEQGFLRRAIEQFEKTLLIDAENLDAHYFVSQCYGQLGKNTAAEAAAAGPPPADEKGLHQLADVFVDAKQSRERRLQAAARLGQGILQFGNQPTDPQQPKLPVLQALVAQCRPVFEQQSDPGLAAAAAFVLGHLHRQEHAIYNPDPSARNRAVTNYREKHPAAARASQAVVIYPLNRPGAPGLNR